MEDVKYGFDARDIINQGRINEKDVEQIKSFIETQKLPNLTDEQLIAFLLACEKDQEATRKTILEYYSIKKKSPELFEDRNVEREDLQLQLQTFRICIFPKRTEDGCVIIYQKLKDTNYLNYEMGPAMKLLLMTLDAAIYDDPPTGVIMLIDLKGYGFKHFMKTKFNLVKYFLCYLQKAMPARLKCIHIFNSVHFIDKLIRLFKPIVSDEVFKTVRFHTSSIDMEDFYTNFVSRECLPEEYGGYLPSIDILHEETTQKYSDLQTFFIAEEEELKKYKLKLCN